MTRYVVTYDEGFGGPLPVGAGTFRILLDEQTSGAKHFSLLVNEIPGGVDGKPHQHEVEHGWYILQGRATFWIRDEPFEVGPNMAVYAPPNIPHRVKTHGPEPLRFVVVYAPAGPERDLRERGAHAHGVADGR